MEEGYIEKSATEQGKVTSLELARVLFFFFFLSLSLITKLQLLGLTLNLAFLGPYSVLDTEKLCTLIKLITCLTRKDFHFVCDL